MIDETGLGTIAEDFHIASRNSAALKQNYRAHLIHYSPEVEKLVRKAPLKIEEGNKINLPPPLKIQMSITETINRRSSGRNFSNVPITSEELSTLLYYGNAIQKNPYTKNQNYYQRNVPNSGNLGSVEVYPIILNVEGIEPGIYHFDSFSHHLDQVQLGNYSTWLFEKGFFQVEWSNSSVGFVITSAIGRLTAKYGLRGYPC